MTSALTSYCCGSAGRRLASTLAKLLGELYRQVRMRWMPSGTCGGQALLGEWNYRLHSEPSLCKLEKDDVSVVSVLREFAKVFSWMTTPAASVYRARAFNARRRFAADDPIASRQEFHRTSTVHYLTCCLVGARQRDMLDSTYARSHGSKECMSRSCTLAARVSMKASPVVRYNRVGDFLVQI
ncbi:hypothetical protein DAEQUDRAFT_465976 [Daedalea quercina L-15889]|uniref:Uncharacterized protein n=1 Tax=Daedalea quercina L-15889 TaxID=1314783 RepID=A0A165TFK5_9APHY|nr:hypothetical protein DAEQUDRAFT_465976 [Daedalea quercina L-15889]